MEQRIKMKPVINYHLEEEEVERAITVIALLHYHYKRTPDYSVRNFLPRFLSELKACNSELLKLCESEPNNRALGDAQTFIKRVYSATKKSGAQLKHS